MLPPYLAHPRTCDRFRARPARDHAGAMQSGLCLLFKGSARTAFFEATAHGNAVCETWPVSDYGA